MMKIGISACFFHSDPLRPVFKGKTLLYIEQSLANYVMSQGALAYMIPPAGGTVKTPQLVQELDGLVLHGGADVAPKSYGEEPLRPEWNGDYVRDQYEIELFKEFKKQGKPVLGVCRGLQLLNVAYGGTLIQDIGTQVETPVNHRNWDVYDMNSHWVKVAAGSRLESMAKGKDRAKVNSVHHQAVKKLGDGLVIEARSEKDDIIEAFRDESDKHWVYAIQWHPEFHDQRDKDWLDSAPLLSEFLKAARK